MVDATRVVRDVAFVAPLVPVSVHRTERHPLKTPLLPHILLPAMRILAYFL
jgi:hypothetical protein